MNPSDALSSLMAGGIMMALLMIVFGISALGLWLFALIHCLVHRQDKDRVVWVLVTLLGGPIGAVIYLLIGRQKTLPPPLAGSRTPSPPVLPLPTPPQSKFDHAAMHDEKKRAQSISDAVWTQAKSSKSRS